MSDVPRRIGNMRSFILEHFPGPYFGFVAALQCDGCGAVINLALQRPDGWSGDGPPDYCPSCTTRRSTEGKNE